MKLDSEWFDKVRVSRGEERPEPEGARCQHPGCRDAGLYRAPKGRDRENEYWRFCLQHVREYNQSYNFFAGMSDEALRAYERDSHVGHRPTWAMGRNGGPSAEARNGADRRRGRNRGWAGNFSFEDEFGMFGEDGPQARPEPRREIKKVEMKSLEALNLGAGATRDEIRARYKELLIRFHPDTNGGDRGAEDKLREIIQAYNYLRSVGLC
ncbi:J domain-containing protein [Chelatococcus sambhunathii]|uniref:J domain-containing protein n=1 Tax=Chelatococcus sambhunathii TaxID=363953 RepID=A0ABU1DG09_9HYPH|nr:J domain-containing protein [Chelatococcus sambhunathii]MDR4307058.1 J domain-containing protein [Chelatococcus sambhunathii]